MKTKRKIIEIDEALCNGCGQCVTDCAEGALKVVDGKARLVAEVFCDGLGACIGGCPTGALQIIERDADEFDEKAVEEHLKQQETAGQKHSPHPAPVQGGCPGSRIQMFGGSPCSESNRPVAQGPGASALSHWPVQIRLVPPAAPFLKGADLLIAADCTPVAYPRFHSELLRDRVVMLGCPKFDDADQYIQKFTDIFRTAGVKSVTIVTMEVPCCSRLPHIVERAMAIAGKSIPVEEVVISTRGEIINRKKAAV